MDFIMQQGVEAQRAWERFVESESLSPKQADQFKTYAQLLLEWNQKVNLTRICTLIDIIAYHFQDSIRLADYIDLDIQNGLADVGCGPGFPGIPLKILMPTLPVFLIEVNQKKVRFLYEVINALELRNIQVCDLDWRTFLRTTNFSIDLFCARASLQPSELIRMFSPCCPYAKEKLVYWASHGWKPNLQVARFIIKQKEYTVGSRKRKLVFFEKS